MSETLSSGLTLTIPQEGEANWTSTVRNSCFVKISEHDHTGSGKGVQIGTNAIAANAVTTAKILDANVTTAKIADANVTEAKLADDAASRSTSFGCFTVQVVNGTAAASNAVRFDYNAEIKVPKACKVTHLSLVMDKIVSSGNVVATLSKNASSTGKTLTITTGNTAYAAITAESYAAGDRIEMLVATNALTLTSSPANLIVDVWGHFTE